MLTDTELKFILHYDPDTGVFKWTENAPKHVRGKVAGTLNRSGYRMIGINKKVYLAHRLVWLYETGHFPKKHIDHINNDKDDNRLVNLREVTHQENCHNRRDTKENGTFGWTYYYNNGLEMPDEVRERNRQMQRDRRKAKKTKA